MIRIAVDAMGSDRGPAEIVAGAGSFRGATAEDDLSGRVALSGVYYPDEPGAYAPNMIQAFVKTDVVASGLLAFGQHIELQWHIPKGEPFQR